MTFFSHYLPNQNFSPPNFIGKCSGLQDFYTFLLFLSKRSWYAMIFLYDTAILAYKIYIPHFHFPVRCTGAYCHKKALVTEGYITHMHRLSGRQLGHVPPKIEKHVFIKIE